MRLEGKVAFITGGGGGIGRATAERFTEEGAKVCIAEIDSIVGKKAAESAKLKGKNIGDAFFIETDVSDTEAPLEEFWRCINLDLLGTFLCSKYVIPEIIKSGGGSVINMSSNVALMALPGRDCYTAVKGAIASMTRSMAVEYAPNKIRVNAIAPSVTLSERVKKLLENSPEIQTISDKHLLGLGEPIHVADLAVYLASDESNITTGQVISVDSGVTIS